MKVKKKPQTFEGKLKKLLAEKVTYRQLPKVKGSKTKIKKLKVNIPRVSSLQKSDMFFEEEKIRRGE